MLRKLLASILIIAIIVSINSCGKPHQTPPTTPTSSCLLTSETVNGGPGYGAAWVYQYDADGNLAKGSNAAVNGVTGDGQLAVSANSIGIGFNKLIFTYSYAGDLKGGTPS